MYQQYFFNRTTDSGLHMYQTPSAFFFKKKCRKLASYTYLTYAITALCRWVGGGDKQINGEQRKPTLCLFIPPNHLHKVMIVGLPVLGNEGGMRALGSSQSPCITNSKLGNQTSIQLYILCVKNRTLVLPVCQLTSIKKVGKQNVEVTV